MKRTAVVMGAADRFGAGLCREFETRGWTVFGLNSAIESSLGAERREGTLSHSGAEFTYPYPPPPPVSGVPSEKRIIPARGGPRNELGWVAAVATVGAAAQHVDILVCNIEQTGGETFRHSFPWSVERGNAGATDFDAMLHAHGRYGLGALRFFEAFLPLAAAGMKRICFITRPDAVVGGRAPSTARIGDRMSWASVHMAAAVMANDLGPDGYSVRLYIPDDGDGGPSQAFDYLTGRVETSPLQIDDYAGNRWSF